MSAVAVNVAFLRFKKTDFAVRSLPHTSFRRRLSGLGRNIGGLRVVLKRTYGAFSGVEASKHLKGKSIDISFDQSTLNLIIAYLVVGRCGL